MIADISDPRIQQIAASSCGCFRPLVDAI